MKISSYVRMHILNSPLLTQYLYFRIKNDNVEKNISYEITEQVYK